MVWDPELVYYFCIAHHNQELEEPIIVAEFNSADSVLQNLAHQCVQHAPPHHLVYTHTYLNRTYTFLVEDPFIYFGVFDWKVPKYDQIQLLGRLKEALNRLMKRNADVEFMSYCFQGELHPIFDNLMSGSLDFDALFLGANGGYGVNTPTPPPPPPPSSGFGKGKKVLSLPLLCSSKIGYGHKKRWLCGDDRSESRDALVDSNMTDSLGDHGVNETKSRQTVCRNGVCLIDGGGRQKARKIWRRHVWIVLILDLAVCLILFGIWLFVCHGFQCIDG